MSCNCGNSTAVAGGTSYVTSKQFFGTPIGGYASPSPPTVAGAVSPSAPSDALSAQQALFPTYGLGLRSGNGGALPAPPTVGGGFRPPSWLMWLLAAIGLAAVIGFILRK